MIGSKVCLQLNMLLGVNHKVCVALIQRANCDGCVEKSAEQSKNINNVVHVMM